MKRLLVGLVLAGCAGYHVPVERDIPDVETVTVCEKFWKKTGTTTKEFGTDRLECLERSRTDGWLGRAMSAADALSWKVYDAAIARYLRCMNLARVDG